MKTKKKNIIIMCAAGAFLLAAAAMAGMYPYLSKPKMPIAALPTKSLPAKLEQPPKSWDSGAQFK